MHHSPKNHSIAARSFRLFIAVGAMLWALVTPLATVHAQEAAPEEEDASPEAAEAAREAPAQEEPADPEPAEEEATAGSQGRAEPTETESPTPPTQKTAPPSVDMAAPQGAPIGDAAAGDAADRKASVAEVSASDEGPTSAAPAEDDLAPGELPVHPVDLGSARYVPGKGLAIESQDGDHALITRLRAQFRYSWFHEPNGADSQVFQIRRARLQFKGHMWGEHNTFKVELAVAPQDFDREPVTVGDPLEDIDEGDLPAHTHGTQGNVVTTGILLDWYMTFDHLRDLTLRVGQYKVPYNRQRVVSSGDLQFVDRAITNAEYNVDRDLGVDLRSKDFLGLDLLRYYAGLYIGEGRNTSDATLGAGDFGFMYIGRVEVLPFGMFDDYSEADFAHTKDFRLSIGAAYAYVSDAPGLRGIRGSTPDGEIDTHNLTADAMMKYDGISVFSDVFWRKGQGDLADNEMPNGVGFMVQGGYLLESLPLEFAARYGMLRSVGDSSLIDENEAGAAISYYFFQHPFKIQADYFHLWDETYGFDDGSDRVRVQMQASF